MLVNDAAGEMLVDEILDAQVLGAFVEDQISTFEVRRRAYRRALVQGGGSAQPPGSPARIVVTGQRCDVDRGVSTFVDSWMAVDLSTMNVLLEDDWEFFFSRVGVEYVLVDKSVWSDWAWEDWEAFADLVGKYLVGGGKVGMLSANKGELTVEASLLGKYGIRQGPIDEVLDDFVGQLYGPYEVFERKSSTSRALKRGVDSTMVINLDRRPDRWAKITAQLKERLDLGLSDITRISASDGNRLDLVNDESVSGLFSLQDWRYGGAVGNPYHDHAYRSNVLGCAHSHYRTWQIVAKPPVPGRISDEIWGEASPIHMVLEDDVVFDENVGVYWSELLHRLRHNHQWDVLFLGTLDDQDIYGDETVFVVGGAVNVQRMSREMRVHGAGAFALLLRPRAAKLLLERARSLSMQQAVDWFIFDAVADGSLVGFKCSPMLASSPEGEGRDSDNDQQYPNSRLLMLKRLGEEDAGVGGGGEVESVNVNFDVPEDGECYVIGEIKFALSIEVEEAATVFMERQRSSKICYDMGWEGDGEEEEFWIESALQERRKVVLRKGEGKARIGCTGFTEEGAMLTGLGPGQYRLEGSLQNLREGTGDVQTFFSVFRVVSDLAECDFRGRCTEVDLIKHNESSGRVQSMTVRWCEGVGGEGGERGEGGESLYDFAQRHCSDVLPHITCVDQVMATVERNFRNEEV
ncbi:hypothetical protein TrST_g1496 [Triparma strigata]|uniref:Glycosyl transferase family 25 domain-containing protein n=1 Tax=Triparma strigata TaxID=1606541 RepID=A0A9W7ENB0_9STRA|nr:hypothetical protein TrST_g1496 [Triparma strigata]